VEVLEYVFRDAIVQHALAFDHLVLLRIEGGRVVLEVLDQCAGFGSLVEDLRLALIDAASAAHGSVPCLEKIHRVPWLRETVRGGASGRCDSANKDLPDRPGNLADRKGEHNRRTSRSHGGQSAAFPPC